MDILEIINKYKNNGIDSIGREEIDYICEYYNNTENIKKLDEDNRYNINNIMYKYCTKFNDSEVALSFASKEYKYDTFSAIFEFLSPYVNNQLDKDNTNILKYDYSYFNYCFALYYYDKSNENEKAFEYLNKGASQNERYCINELVRYYVKDPESFVEPEIEKIDFDNALYYAQLSFNLFEEVDAWYFDDIFDEIEKLPEEEKNKYENIIYNSKELLYQYFLHIYDYEENDKDRYYESLYLCSISSIFKYQPASFNLDKKNNYRCIYNNPIFTNNLYTIEKAIINEDVKELSNYSDKELFCYGVYFLRQKLYNNAYVAFKMASLKNNKYAMYAIGLYDLNNKPEKDLEYLIKAYELGCLQATRVILYNKKFISQCLDKRESFINDIYENSTSPNELFEFGCNYYNGNNYNSDYNVLESNYEEALKFLEKSKKYGKNRLQSDILTIKYLLGEEIDFKEYLENTLQIQHTEYLNKIKKLSDNGSNVIGIDILSKCRELREKNPDSNVIDLLINYVDSLPNDSIINIKQSTYIQPIRELYDINDIKSILQICKNLLSGIDINQKEEDIFMQIYIRLSEYIKYDNDVSKYNLDESDERYDTSRNILILSSKAGVCGGYSYALKFLLDIMGIECTIVSSKRDINGMGHAFNQVKINNKWYYCDVTWDQNLMKFGLPTFCLSSYDKFINNMSINKNNELFHIALNKNMIYSADDNYKNMFLLFQKNRIKLIKQNIFSKIKKIDMDDNQKVI